MHGAFDSTVSADRGSELDALDLTCPACESDLITDELFLSHRVCGTCNRHFSIGARERVSLVVDSGSFEEINADFTSAEANITPDQYPSAERLAEHQHMRVIADAIVSGVGPIGGTNTVVIALDDHLVGATLGALMTEKIILALEYARIHKHPVVLLCAGGTSSAQAGPLALVQGGRLATALTLLHLESVPIAGAINHPIAGSIFGMLAAHCDVLFSEPGVLVRTPVAGGSGAPDANGRESAGDLLRDGWIDGIVDRPRLKGQLAAFVDVVCNPGLPHEWTAAVAKGTTALSARESLVNLRHPNRPGASAFVPSLFSRFIELHGDRVAADDLSVTCGIGRFESRSVAVAAQRRESEPAGDHSAAAARKIARVARIAGRLELPLLLFVDAGANDQASSFSPGSAFAINSLTSILTLLPVPVISIGTGTVSGPLATGLMIGDRQFLMSSAVYAPAFAVNSGPGTFPSPPRAPRAQGRATAESGVLTSRECDRLGLIDGVIDEPMPGAHADPEATLVAIRAVLRGSLAELTGTGQRRLLDTRHRRQRTLGQSTPAGLAAARSELWELHEWQRSVGRSIDEWRERWDVLKASQPRLSFHRPDINELATRLRTRRSELLERAGLGDHRSSN